MTFELSILNRVAALGRHVTPGLRRELARKSIQLHEVTYRILHFVSGIPHYQAKADKLEEAQKQTKRKMVREVEKLIQAERLHEISV